MCMCAYICICIYVHVHVCNACVCVYVYVCKYVYMYIIYMYICIYMYIYMHICIYAYMYIIYMYICIYVYICIYAYMYIIYIYMYTCIYVYICIYAYMYICVYVYMYVCVCVCVYIYIFFLSLSLALKESLAAAYNALDFTKAAITPDSLATTLLQTGCGCTHVQPLWSTVRGVLQCGQYFVLLVPGYSFVIAAPQRMRYPQTGVVGIPYDTPSGIHRIHLLLWREIYWDLGLIARSSAWLKRSQRQACRLDCRRSGFPPRDLM